MVLNEELVRVYGFWSGVLVLKMLSMSILTARMRFKKKVFANHDDAKMLPKARVAYDDEDVERVRRSHLNDLENILPWVAITWIYLGTDPSPFLAGMLIRGFAIARIGHTLFYAILPMQPFRGISFGVGLAITAVMAVSSIIHYV